MGVIDGIPGLEKKVFVIGIYYGQEKPSDPNSYLKEFVAEMEDLMAKGFYHNEVLITVRHRPYSRQLVPTVVRLFPPILGIPLGATFSSLLHFGWYRLLIGQHSILVIKNNLAVGYPIGLALTNQQLVPTDDK